MTNKYHSIDFQSFLSFYQIFVFQNTPVNVLIHFVCKYFMYTQDNIILEEFIHTLQELANHTNFDDIQNMYTHWLTSLENYPDINYNNMSSVLKYN